MNTTTSPIQRPKARRVTFDGLDSDEERERSERGVNRRKKNKELKRKRKLDMAQQGEEVAVTEAEMADTYKYIMNPNMIEKLNRLYHFQEYPCDHEDIDEKSKKFFCLFVDSLFTALLVPEQLSFAEKLKWLHEKGRTFEKSIKIKYVDMFLKELSRNLHFRKHCKFVSDPLSDSETSTSSLAKGAKVHPSTMKRAFEGTVQQFHQGGVEVERLPIDQIYDCLLIAQSNSEDGAGSGAGNEERVDDSGYEPDGDDDGEASKGPAESCLSNKRTKNI